MNGPRAWWPDVLLLAGFVGLTAALASGALLDVDLAVRDWCDTHRPAPLRLAAYLLNFAGSANLLGALSLALAAILATRDRSPRPIVPVLATLAASYLFVVPLKVLADRAAPHSSKPRAVELFANDAGWSYPSGHVVNTLIWYPLLVLLIAAVLRRPALPRWVLAVPVVIVSTCATYLAFHWLSDVVAGLLLGLVLARGLQRLGQTRAVAAAPGRPPPGPLSNVGR